MIFIDTGAFVARYIHRDQHHAQATAVWDELARDQTRCFTSNLVLNEAVTLLARRTDYRFAAETARRIYSSSALEILRPDMNDEVAGIFFLEKYADRRVSYCDCVSFMLMKRFNISIAFTFDDDFAVAGFNTRPQG